MNQTKEKKTICYHGNQWSDQPNFINFSDPFCYHGNQWSDLAKFQTHSSSHVCYHYLQVKKGSDQEQPRKSGDIVFPIIIKPIEIFSDVQGQLTQQSVVQSGRNWNLSELSCMSSLHASMKRIRRKTAEKKWRHRLFPS